MNLEHRKFYNHWGLSLRSVARAIMINTLSLSYRQGFSTLTQQLAINLYKSVGFEDSILRKVKEVRIMNVTSYSDKLAGCKVMIGNQLLGELP